MVLTNTFLQNSFLAAGLSKEVDYCQVLLWWMQSDCECMKSVQIRNFFCSVFSRIRTEYGEIRSISPYSVQRQESTNQKNSVSLHIQYKGRKVRTRKNSVFRQFSRSDGKCSETLFSRTTHKKWNIKISKNPCKYGPVWKKILTQNQNKCVFYLSFCSEEF